MDEAPQGKHRRQFRMRHGKGGDGVSHAGGGRNRCHCLNDREAGSRCRIRSVGGTIEVRQRLLDLGIMPDADVEVVRSAPLNDPVQIRLGDDNVSIRRSEAALIEVDDDE